MGDVDLATLRSAVTSAVLWGLDGDASGIDEGMDDAMPLIVAALAEAWDDGLEHEHNRFCPDSCNPYHA